MPTYRPAIGPRDFEGISCDLDHVPTENQSKKNETLKESATRTDESKDDETKYLVIKTVMLSIVAAISVTGVYGLISHDWTPVTVAWSVGGAPFGAILTKYVGNNLDASNAGFKYRSLG
jgi:hypothetical protein